MTQKTDWMKRSGRRDLSLTPTQEVYDTFRTLVGGLYGKSQVTAAFSRMVGLTHQMKTLAKAGWTFQAVSPSGDVVVFDLGMSATPNEGEE